MGEYGSNDVEEGNEVYIDLGDSILTGGEFTGIVEDVSDAGIYVDGGRFIAFESILDLAVLS